MLTLEAATRIPTLGLEAGLDRSAVEEKVARMQAGPGVYAVRARDPHGCSVLAILREPSRRNLRELAYCLDPARDETLAVFVDRLADTGDAWVNVEVGESYHKARVAIVGEVVAIVEEPVA